jgi:hypothetical protein
MAPQLDQLGWIRDVLAHDELGLHPHRLRKGRRAIGRRRATPAVPGCYGQRRGARVRPDDRGLEAVGGAGDEAAVMTATRAVTPSCDQDLRQNKQRLYGAPDRGRDRRPGTMKWFSA